MINTAAQLRLHFVGVASSFVIAPRDHRAVFLHGGKGTNASNDVAYTMPVS